MATEKVEYSPSKTCADFMRSRKKIKVINGPVGSGKSVACLMSIARECQLQAPGPDGIRRSRWAIIRNTNQQLMDTVLKSFFQWFPDGAAGHWKVSEKTFFLKFGDVQAEIMFRPLDSAADLQRLLSLELTSAYFNEAREINKTIFDGVRTRIGRYPAKKDGGASYAHIICDTNPPDMDSWLYDLMENPGPRDRELIEIFKQPSGLSPEAENLENLPQGYYEDMMIGASKDFIDVHVHGLYGKSNLGKPVHSRFDESMHVRSGLTPEPGILTIIGMDFGLTPAAVFKQIDGWGRVNTFDALWSEDSYLEKFIENQVMPTINRKYARCPIYVMGDPSGKARGQGRGESCFDVIEDFGLAFEKPDNISNDPGLRMGATDHFLSLLAGDSAPAYAVDKKNCAHLISALRGGYRFNQKRNGEFQMTVDKANPYSHVAEANQYGDMFYHGKYNARYARKVQMMKEQAIMSRYTPLDADIGY